MKKVIRLGILAGMGPRSTAPFMEMVLDECQNQYGAKYDIDFPHIIVYSLPTPFYIDKKVDDEELSKSIKEGLEYLEATGVDIIAIPCNSAHKYFTTIVKNITIPVINIIEETMKVISPSSKTTILATGLTMETNLYQNGLESNKCEFIFKDEWQSIVNSIILEIKTNGASERAIKIWKNLRDELLLEGIQSVIIACTDLNVIITDDKDLSIIDSSNVLARKIINEYIKLK